MGQRKKIGLLFDFDENWTGGLYYLFNIINSLNRLPESEKPQIIIFYRNENIKEDIVKLGYSFISFLPIYKRLSLPDRVITRLVQLLFYKKYYPQYARDIVSFLFPCSSANITPFGSLRRVRKVYWIPDFQHKHLPHFFSTAEINSRDRVFEKISQLEADLVLSSDDARRDFAHFYPKSRANVKVLPFASVLPAYQDIKLEDLIKKYKINSSYFISPNQFWVHKNHLVVLRAALLLQEEKVDFQILFTGKEYDHRNPEYTDSLKSFVVKNGLADSIKFLGFIDRKDQLSLIQNAIAVIQPSLFEGWSTVVEDCKAINQTIILSDLNVHREQCKQNALYFNPKNERELASLIKKCINERITFPPYSYNDSIKQYARGVINL